MNSLANPELTIVQIELGGWIRAARKACGWTQVDLAALSGLHVSHLSKIERGEANVTIASLFAITNALRINFFESLQDFRLPGQTEEVLTTSMEDPPGTPKLTQ